MPSPACYAARQVRHHEVIEREALPALYPAEFLVGLMDNPNLVRNIALVGHLHHGKTSLMDMLVEQTHVRHRSALRRASRRVFEPVPVSLGCLQRRARRGGGVTPSAGGAPRDSQQRAYDAVHGHAGGRAGAGDER